ncbi:MAG: LytTR family transcriptional regulator [Lachnospiraceae bacterium]|nr:LytTR family transcriptional regulator [Lachnospiraceae bacterium]
MRDLIDIDVVIDENFIEPKVTIRTKERTAQVENIICAIENVSGSDFPPITANQDKDKIVIISQRDIIRIYTSGRKIMVQTGTGIFSVKKTLTGLEEDLNRERFLRISQSEIINLYKVKCFDINIAGTIGIEFDDGTKSWVSRSRVKAIKNLLEGKKEVM